MRKQLEILKSVYETKIQMIDVDLETETDAIVCLSLVNRQKIYRKFVSEIDEILNS